MPRGWHFADWSGRKEAEEFWKAIPAKPKATLRVRMEEVLVAQGTGRRLHHTKHYYREKMGVAKVVHPSPGWRAMHFRDGDDQYISHFAEKADQDSDADLQKTLKARKEHLENKDEDTGKDKKNKAKEN